MRMIFGTIAAAVAEAKLAPPKLEDYTPGDIVTVMVGGKLRT